MMNDSDIEGWEAEHGFRIIGLIDMIEEGGWIPNKGSLHPYLYSKHDKQLVVSQEACDKYETSEIDAQVSVLKRYLTDAMTQMHDNDGIASKETRSTIRVSKGIMQKLGISWNRRVTFWDSASRELLDSLNAHEQFHQYVKTLYNNMIKDKEYIPLTKVHGKGMVKDGNDIIVPMQNHCYRIAREYHRQMEE